MASPSGELATRLAMTTLGDGHRTPEPDSPVASLLPESGPKGAPSKVGRYVVLDVLGMGGMGVVCTAYDPKLDRKVALKLLRRRGGKSKRGSMGRARLVREAQALAKLSHPNIVTVHDVDTTPDGRIYMAMEFVQGHTITEWSRARPRSWKEVLTVFDFAGRGLSVAHAAGITHRDFKPANVLIGRDGRVRVLDFGLAKNAGDASDSNESEDSGASLDADDIMRVVHSATDMKLTMAGRIVGTPAYMAPEQRSGKLVGPATDQFSFAVALYEALYDRLPFRSESHYRDASRGRVLDPPKETECPAWVFRALKRALSPKPAERYASMADLLAALRADPARRRRVLLAAVGGGTLLGGAVLLAVAAVQPDDERCSGSAERIASAWDETRAASVDAALRSTKTAYAAHTAERVRGQLDAFADAWVDARVHVCEATWVHGEQSEATLDARMACLDQRRGELRAQVDVLADADAQVVERAVSAVAALTAPSHCLEPSAGSPDNQLPTDPDQRSAVLAAHALADDAEALLRAGRYQPASRAADQALDAAKRLDHDPTLARALFVRGVAARRNADYDAADASLTEAIELAAAAADPMLEARAHISLVRVYGVHKRNRERALGLAEGARSAIARAGGSARLRASLAQELGATSLAAKELDAALREQREALKFAELAYSANDLRFASLYANLGVTLAQLGEAAEAETYLRRALELRENKLGEMHPRVAGVAQNLAHVLASRPEAADEALGLIDRALRIRRATFGPEHASLADLWVAKARLHKTRGEVALALEEYQRGVAVYQEAGDNRRLARTLNNISVLEHEGGRAKDAETTARTARALFGAGDSTADKEGAALSELLICGAVREQGRWAEAEAACKAAIKGLGEVYGETDARLADALLELARVHRDQGHTAAAVDYARRSVAASDSEAGRAEATALLEELQDGPKRVK